MAIQGRAWLFPANITTEDILPNQYLDRANDQVGQFAMAGVDPGFASKVQPGDFVVGGANFGTGSSRESAPIALKLAGVGAVIAPSFGRVFFRNCVNIGLPAAMVESVNGIEQGDALILDLAARTVTNTRSGEAQPVINLTGVSLEILNAGGIVAYTKQRLAQREG